MTHPQQRQFGLVPRARATVYLGMDARDAGISFVKGGTQPSGYSFRICGAPGGWIVSVGRRGTACTKWTEFLCEHFHPHVTVVVTPTTAELSSGLCSHNTIKFVRD